MSADPDFSTNGATPSSQTEAVLRALPDALHDAVHTLLTQVEAAEHQIQTLRSENERLRQRVAALEERPDIPPSAFVLPLDTEDPDALNRELGTYIQALDALLDELPPPSSANDDASSA